MAHKQQRDFIKSVRWKYPKSFIGVNVFDVGSADINGNNSSLFWWCNYIGIDLDDKAPNVDVVGHATEVIPKHILTRYGIDTMISTEALEHDKYWYDTLGVMYKHLRKGGLLLITCAGDGRPEHGTNDNSPNCSPATNDWYRNISNEMFQKVLPPSLFSTYFIRQHDANKDLQFYGIKK
jgi:hypothetical protein